MRPQDSTHYPAYFPNQIQPFRLFVPVVVPGFPLVDRKGFRVPPDALSPAMTQGVCRLEVVAQCLQPLLLQQPQVLLFSRSLL